MKIAIIGAGRQAEFVVDVAQDLGYEVTGLYDDRYPEVGEAAGVPVRGPLSAIGAAPTTDFAIGIADPRVRQRLWHLLSAQGKRLPALVHPSAVVSQRAAIGAGAFVGALCTVLAGSSVGTAACLMSTVNVNQNVSVGDFALIGAGVVIGNDAVIGEGCHIAMGARIARLGSTPPWQDVG